MSTFSMCWRSLGIWLLCVALSPARAQSCACSPLSDDVVLCARRTRATPARPCA